MVLNGSMEPVTQVCIESNQFKNWA